MAANGSQNQDAPNQGGLYKHVKMSVRSANILVGVLLAALVIVIVFVAINNGFTAVSYTHLDVYKRQAK